MKILIFGIVASGKTTLAKRLSEEMHIPYFEGDCIAWGFPGEERYKRTDEEQLDTIKMIDEKMSWIVEGTYRKMHEDRLMKYREKVIWIKEE